jgi:hypothetical protein
MHFIEHLLATYPHVHIHADKRQRVQDIVDQLIHDGRALLQVVADYDFTLTIYEKDGHMLPSTHAVIENDDRVRVSPSVRSRLVVVIVRDARTNSKRLFSRFSCLMVHLFENKPTDYA